MDRRTLSRLIEHLRKQAIGAPQWLLDKQVFEYREHSPKVVAVLKLVRATHALSTLEVLCERGLFIDLGAATRSLQDALNEVYFLLEGYPNASADQLQFTTGFFEETIDEERKTHMVTSQKIQAAVTRFLKGQHDHETLERIKRLYKTFSGYAHAGYPHIMEVYNGGADDFSLLGVPSVNQKVIRMEHVEAMTISVLHAAAILAGTLGLFELRGELMRHVRIEAGRS